MKTGEATYRQSRAPRNVRQAVQKGAEPGPDDHTKSSAPSSRTQRRMLESEERRRKRKQRRNPKAKEPEA